MEKGKDLNYNGKREEENDEECLRLGLIY